MLARYSQWIGDTLRRWAYDMSIGETPSCDRGRIGTGSYPASPIILIQFRRYRRLACIGISDAGKNWFMKLWEPAFFASAITWPAPLCRKR